MVAGYYAIIYYLCYRAYHNRVEWFTIITPHARAGTVQGVGFRAATKRAAVEAGCAGWVANVPGGQVEVVAEGTREQLEVGG